MIDSKAQRPLIAVLPSCQLILLPDGNQSRLSIQDTALRLWTEAPQFGQLDYWHRTPELLCECWRLLNNFVDGRANDSSVIVKAMSKVYIISLDAGARALVMSVFMNWEQLFYLRRVEVAERIARCPSWSARSWASQWCVLKDEDVLILGCIWNRRHWWLVGLIQLNMKAPLRSRG